MAGIDTSMYANLTPPAAIDPLASMNKALAYRNLQSEGQIHNIQAQEASQKYNDSLAMRNAQDNATKVNPDGSVSTDQNKMLTELGQTAPHLVLQAKAAQMQQQQAMQEFQMKQMQDHATIAAQTFSKVNDQASFDDAKVTATQMGYDISHWPQKYYGNEDWVKTQAKNAAYAAMNPSQRIEAQQKEQEGQNKKQELANEGKKLDIENFKTFGATPGKGGAAVANPNVDPATLVPHVVPPDRQKDVFEEVKRAQNIGKNGPDILGAFDDASKDNTIMRTGAGLARTPGSVMALHQLLLPNFKTIDGTVRQAAMDETFHNVTPQPGDTAAKIAQKREALKDWMLSESAAPTAKGFGIDLGKYKSTSIDPKILAGGGKDKVADIHPDLVGMSKEQLLALRAKVAAQGQAKNGQ